MSSRSVRARSAKRSVIFQYDSTIKISVKSLIDSKCRELPEYEYYDGRHTIFLSTRGNNADEVPEDIVTFLRFVDADLERSREDFGSGFIARLRSHHSSVMNDREYILPHAE